MTVIFFGVDRLAVELPQISDIEDEVWYDYSLSFMMIDGVLYVDRETCTVTEAPLEVCAKP